MKIAVDYFLAKKHLGGMRVFVTTLIENLKKTDRQNKYILITNPTRFDNKNIFTKLLSAIRADLWCQTKLAFLFKKNQADVLYCPNPPVPLLFEKPILLTIPDMAFYVSDKISIFTKGYYYLLYFLSAHKARLITTFSKNSKKDICHLLKINPRKVHVTPLAASNIFTVINQPDKLKEILKKHHLDQPYILSAPGTFLPRKNIKDLIIAFSLLPKNIKNKLHLVLIGNTASLEADELQRLIEKLGLSDKIQFTGYVENDKELVYLFNGAMIYAFPSLYEGFGLSPLEAMQCGIPTIVYNKSSLPEVVGKAALKVDNPRQLAKAIINLWKNKNLRNKLRREGFKRTKKYSWKKTAMIYKDLININFG